VPGSPDYTPGLAERGFDEAALTSILGGNHLRLLKAVIG
jgi:microsomal dipeptidase-like Zn-dependent dipeptidase